VLPLSRATKDPAGGASHGLAGAPTSLEPVSAWFAPHVEANRFTIRAMSNNGRTIWKPLITGAYTFTAGYMSTYRPKVGQP